MRCYRFLWGALSSLILISSCENKIENTGLVEEDQTITIQASIADAMPEGTQTKTIFDENSYKVYWSPGDQISLFYGSGSDGGSLFTATNTDNALVTNFTGTIGVITGGAEITVDQTYFWGLYPYDANASCDGTSIITTLSPNQKAIAGTFDLGANIWIGRSQSLGLSFYNVCTGICVRVEQEGVVKMTLRTLDGSYLAGKASISFDSSGYPRVDSIIEGYNYITLSAPEGECLVPGQNYYFMFFPHSFMESAFSITFETMTKIATYTRPTLDMNCRRSIIESFYNPRDRGLTYVTKTGNIPIEDVAFKTWLTTDAEGYGRFDTNGDGDISYAEAEAITEIWMDSDKYNIVSLKGIEYMPNLTHLLCGGTWKDPLYENLPDHYYISPNRGTTECGPIGTLKYVDVSYNPNLVYLNLGHNEGLGDNMPDGLDLSHNSNLEELDISYNLLPFPNIAHLTKLKKFTSKGNKGSVPDFSQFTTLTRLWIEDTRTDHSYSVNISNCSDLEELYVQNTSGAVTGFNGKTKLKTLVLKCWYPYVAHSSMAGTIQEALPGLTNLEQLDVEGMGLTGSLALADHTKLKWLNFINNQLTGVTLPSSLLEIVGSDNPQLGAIDVSSMANLEKLECANTGLSAIDVTHNPKLWKLSINDNQISSIDLSHNPLLEELAIWNCGLSELDMSANPEMTWVRCWGNHIAVLDVSHNPKLGTRASYNHPHDNGLSCSPMNELTTLYIDENQSIPFVTVNRSTDHIPEGTQIYYKQAGSGEPILVNVVGD